MTFAEIAGPLLVIGVFGGFGYGLWRLYRHGKSRAELQARRAAEYPDEPWLQRDDWAEGRLKSSSKVLFIAVFVMAVGWNLVSLPLLFLVPGEITAGNLKAGIALLFPIAGVGLAAFAAVLWRRHQRFSSAELLLTHLPLQRGGWLEAKLCLPMQLPQGTRLSLSLSCVHSRVTGSGDSRRRSETIYSQERAEIPAAQQRYSGIYWWLPVHMPIADSGYDSSVVIGNNGFAWRLNVATTLPGADLALAFDLPVFGTADERAASRTEHHVGKVHLAASRSAAAQRRDEVLPEELAKACIETGHDRYGFYLRLRRGRNALVLIPLGICGVVFTAIGVGLLSYDTLFIGGIFAAVGLLLALLFLSSALRKTEVYCRSGELSLTSGMLWQRQQRFSIDEIQTIKLVRGMQVNQQLYYRLRLVLKTGRSLTLMRGLPSRALAMHVRDEIVQHCRFKGELADD